jgi:serine/threonine protein kinase
VKATSARWVEVSPSRYAHEREGLEHVRDQLPDADPYRAWANVEFVALDGTPYEVDLVVLGPAGFHLVELKAWSGRIEGDERDWLEHNPGSGRPIARRSPLWLTRLKAQAFRSWLEHHARRSRTDVPYVHESLFLHGQGVDCRLPDRVKERVFGREDATGNGLRRIVTDRVAAAPGRARAVDANRSRALADLVQSAGLRRRRPDARVGEWVLEEDAYDGGWGWQDNLAHHHSFAEDTARVRRWFAPAGASATDQAVVRRAAEREYRMLRDLSHPGLVTPRSFHDLDGAVALAYDHDPNSVPLDDWLRREQGRLEVGELILLVREVAEVVRYAHEHGLVHRGLSPRSVLVRGEPGSATVRVKDWQTAGRADPASSSATTHARELLAHAEDGAGSVYCAPEVLSGTGGDRRAADVFSLGALAYLVVTGEPPATDPTELRERLRAGDGLDLASVLDAPPAVLAEAVREATRPAVARRTATVPAFTENLDLALDEVTEPDATTVLDPLEAGRGDVLEGGYEVVKVLGEGSTSVALLVRTGDGSEAVLKVARDDQRADRLEEEAVALSLLTGTDLVVRLLDGPLLVGGRSCLLMERAGGRTLAEELQARGRLSLDRLERWGRDLLEAAALLERAGVHHRDVKPANLGVRTRSTDRQAHLVLFDFSLAGASSRDREAGTPGYRDPFLGVGPRRQYDQAAELFSVAVTLHEMATGVLPVWGDGRSNPAAVDDEVTLALDALGPAVAASLGDFLRRALARDAKARFANPQDMSVAWQQVFAVREDAAQDPDAAAAAATLDTPLAEAGLSQRALSALVPYDAHTVRDLLAVDPLELSRLPGAAQPTKDEVVGRARTWRRDLLRTAVPAASTARSIDVTLGALLPVDDGSPAARVVRLLLGQRDEPSSTGPLEWPTTAHVAGELELPRGEVSTAWTGFLAEAAGRREVQDLRADVLTHLQELGGVGSAPELAARLLDARGSHATDAHRRAQALAVLRLVVEAGQGPGVVQVRRTGEDLLVAGGTEMDASTVDELLETAGRLGRAAEELARAEVLATSATVLARLRETVTGTALEQLPDARLPTLAAAATGAAAASPRGELYPHGMTPLRALRQAGATLVVAGGTLSEQTLRRRVAARFPDAAALPARPALDRLVAEAGLELIWSGDGYAPAAASTRRSSTHSSTWHGDAAAATPERVDARLAESLDQLELVALAVPARYAEQARARLLDEHPVTEVDVTRELLGRLREVAAREGAQWESVLGADALPAHDPDRQVIDDVLRELARNLVEEVAATEEPVLLTECAILARHRCTDLLAPLAGFDSRRAAAVWLLAPQASSQQSPTLDGAALPLGSPNQWLTLPTPWVLAASSRTA